MYGSGKYCPQPGKCLDLDQLSDILRTSTDSKALLDAWRGWHTISPPMRPLFERYVELGNKGARELGFADMGAMWRSKYDLPPDAFTAEMDRLWDQVRPLYVALHAYVRRKLREKYGDIVPASGPIPAHLLGNMWAQEWENIYPLVAPKNADPGYDLTAILKSKNTQPLDMVRYGEHFFTSLGFAPLPKTFWERSMFVKPRDRDVVCHASAWDVDAVDDLRIKLCIEINAEDFSTIHHELGHNFYQRAYDKQPFLFRDSANDGFHEAIGDTIALSVTPEYLKKIGLLASVPDSSKDIGILLKTALERVAFLPFGLMIDKWRWQVFSGAVPPGKYNQAWWDLRLKYQGISPPVARSESDFDRGREVSRRGELSLRPLFSVLHFAIPVSSRTGQDRRLHRPAEPLFHLRQQGGGPAAEQHARDGFEPALAGGPGRAHRPKTNGRYRDSGLFRASEEMAGPAESRPAGGLVKSHHECGGNLRDLRRLGLENYRARGDIGRRKMRVLQRRPRAARRGARQHPAAVSKCVGR